MATGTNSLFPPHQDLLERFEETLAEAVQAGEPESEYAAGEQEAGQPGQDVTSEQQRDRQALAGGRFQSPVDSLSRTASGRRSHLLDLLVSRRRAASCFGARMDRIGNSGGLGCNNGKGKTSGGAVEAVWLHGDHGTEDRLQ